MKNKRAEHKSSKESAKKSLIFKYIRNRFKVWLKFLQMKTGGTAVKDKLKGRISSIDIFRGLAIAMMLIMENPGNPAHVSPQLVHAPWNGLTFADLGFPFFIFIAGASLPVSIRKRRDRGDSKLSLYVHILYRGIVIFLAGLFLNGFPAFDFNSIRIPGPLQRIAILYIIAGIFVLETNMIIEAVTAAGILVVYYLMMKYINVPGAGAGILSKDGNLAQYIDIKLLSGHMYTPVWDPEGIVGTIPSISTILSGVICGQTISSTRYGRAGKMIGIITTGTLCMLIGNYTNQWFPINKNLWSSSFVLYTSGLAFIIIGILYFISDVKKYTAAFKPFIILGKDPFFIYIGFELVRRTLWVLTMPDPVSGTNIPLYLFICNRVVTPWAGNAYDSYYFSLIYTLLWVIIVRYMRGKKASDSTKYVSAD